MGASQQSVQVALANAASAGIISVQTSKAMISELDDIALAGCDGISIDAIDSEEVTLVSVIIDASGSMSQHRNAVIKSYNESFLGPMRKAKNADSILVSLWVFSEVGDPSKLVRLIHSYLPVSQCPDLTASDYDPDGMTPLNQAVYSGEMGQVAYGQTLRDNGTRTKNIILVLSDGFENASKIPVSKVRTMSSDLLNRQEFVLSYVYFGDPSKSDDDNEAEGDKMAAEIGFPKRHRLTVGKTDADIRRLFGTCSASVISASQTKVSAGTLSSNPFFQKGR